MDMSRQRRTVFCSYATPDRDRVNRYVDYLERAGHDIWIDYRSIRAGQRWDYEIALALERADIVLMFISRNSIDRRGYVQKEMRAALDKLDEKLSSDIYIVPVLLDQEIDLPHELKRLHYVRGWELNGPQQVESSLQTELKSGQERLSKLQEESQVRWEINPFKEEWDGIPGYRVSCPFVRFESTEYENVGQIATVLNGILARMILHERAAKINQLPGLFDFGQDKWSRTNTLDVHISRPSFTGKIVGFQFTVHTYGAGAAHPQHHFISRSFFLDPVVEIRSPRDLFSDADGALEVIQGDVRRQVIEARNMRLEDPIDEDTAKSLDERLVSGTDGWNAFTNFLLKEGGIEFSFPPYQVGTYAEGVYVALVPYEKLSMSMFPLFTSALELRYLRWEPERPASSIAPIQRDSIRLGPG